MITAPFNFVPLNEKVFFPPWADEVSHDVPFKDGESGSIDITITAKSPIFIRDSVNEEQFCNHNGVPYIPGSSIKGMIRSVLEIMSFSKLNESLFTDNTYSMRDLSDSNNFYMKQMKKPTKGGWLKKEGNNYIIEDCGEIGRIKHEEIDKIFKIDFASKFKKGKFGNKADDKTALKKYNMIESDNFTYPFTHTTTSTVGDKRYAYDKNSSKIGTIVLTGQPSGRDESRKIPSGKAYEFVFFEKRSDIKLDEITVENFLFAYFDKRTTEPKESLDWKYWKQKLNNGEKVPVFFQKNGNKIAHFGLSYLYKLPYNHSVKDGIKDIHFDDTQHDLAETIFGYTNKSDALKGRVQFSHFKAINNIKQLDKRTEILGTPRASYYPIYVKQKGKLFTTFMDDFEIVGRKRYPIHKGSCVINTEDTGNENVGTTFSPLQDGVVFKGKLRYHNLKKSELGAILSALTFHNTANTFHNIGMAKSLGYGKVAIKIDGIKDIISYLKEFELITTEQIVNWKDSIQLKELLTMSTEQNNAGESKLEYMILDNFTKNKVGENKDYLKCYSELNNIAPIIINSLINENDLEELRLKNIEFERIKEQNEQKKKALKQHNKEWEIVNNTTNIATVESFISKYPKSSKIEEAKGLIAIIEKDLKNKKRDDIINDIKKAFENLDKKNKKHRESFIKKYKENKYAQEFVTQLKNKDENTPTTSSLEELNIVQNSKKFKSILDANEEILEENKEIIKSNAIRVYNSLKGKQKKNFFKDIQLGRFLGNDFENEVKNQI